MRDMEGVTRISPRCSGEDHSEEEDVSRVRQSSGCAGKHTHMVLPLIWNLKFATRAYGIFSFVIRAQRRFFKGCRMYLFKYSA